MKKWFWFSVATMWLMLITLQLLPPEVVYKLVQVRNAVADITDLTGYTGYVGQEDINYGSGQDTDTFTIVGYNGTTVTLTKVPAIAANVASIIKGKWYVEQTVGDQCDVAVEGSIAWIEDVIDGDNAVIHVPGNEYAFACDTDYEIPSNIVLVVDNGALFTLASGVTLTSSGTLNLLNSNSIVFQGGAGGGTETLAYANGAQLIAPWNKQIYGSNLTVTYGTSIPEAYPEHWGIDGTADEVQINAAITALSKGDVVLNGQSYTVDASITGATNVNLRGREGITTINIGTADINAFYADTKTNITISGIKWNGSGANADTERLVYFTGCTDIEVHHCILTNSIIGVQFETCTNANGHHNKVYSILRKTDFSEGYGFLCNLNNSGVDISYNYFNDIGRHCIYFSSGSSNCIASHNTMIDSTGAPISVFSTDAQNTMRNIQISNNIINGIQTAGGGTDDVNGINATTNIDGLQIVNNQIYHNDVGGGVLVQNNNTDTATIKNVLITGNSIDYIGGGHGISIINGADVIITNNQIKAVDVVGGVKSGISINVAGTDVGSFADNIIIENNIIDTGKYGITMGGSDATHKLTNLVLGDNYITNATTSSLNMGTIDYITYKTTWDTYKPDFFVDNAAANQTDVTITAGNGSGYNAFIVPFSGWLYSVFARVNGTITDESITFEFEQNGNPRSQGVTIAAGDLYEKEIFAIGTRAVAEGDVIQCAYTTPAGYLPATLEAVCGFEIIRDINQ